MAKRSWPKEVPVLSAHHIIRDQMDDPSGRNRHCLLGWCSFVFPEEHHGKVHKKMLAIIRKQDRHGDSIASFNDNKGHSRAQIAEMWNQAMAKLGYTEGNPEAR